MDTVLYREYLTESVKLSSQRAAEYAFSEIERELSVLSSRVELLDKTFCFELTDEAYVLTCQITCVENIAVTQRIELDA